MKTSRRASRFLLELSLSTALSLVVVAGASAAPVQERAQPTDACPPGSCHEQNKPVGTNLIKLPLLPAGVSELKFSDFFVAPTGSRGLEFTAKLRDLDGRRVRILGYMVRQEDAPPGRLLLTPVPSEIHEHDNGLADLLPPSTVFVSVPTVPKAPVPHTPGLLLLTGTLRVGNRAEPDGRISAVRLELDPPPSVKSSKTHSKFSTPVLKGAERLTYRASHPPSTAP